MPSHSGPNIKGEENLVFGYDLKNPKNSYKGQPAINLVDDAANMSGWGSYSAGNNGTFITEFGTVGYKIRHKNTWNGLHKSLTLPSVGTYTVSAWLRLWDKTPGNNGINVYTNRGGINDTAQGGDDTKLGEWQRISMTRTYTDTPLTFFLISWGGTRDTDWSSWDVTMPQIEVGSKATAFVDGVRGATDSLLDITGNNTIDISNVSFDSNEQITFDGTDDWLNVPITLNAGNFTYETVIKQFGSTSYDIFTAGTGDPSNGGTNIQARVSSGGGVVNLYAPVGGSGWEWGTYDNTGNFTATSNVNYHIVVVNLNTNWKIYVNGELVGDIDSFVPTVGNRVGVARSAMQAANDKSSEVPLTRIYNRALTVSEIKANFNSIKSRFNIA